MRTAEEYVELAERELAKGGNYETRAQVFAALAQVAAMHESDLQTRDLAQYASRRLEEEEAYRKTLG